MSSNWSIFSSSDLCINAIGILQALKIKNQNKISAFWRFEKNSVDFTMLIWFLILKLYNIPIIYREKLTFGRGCTSYTTL